MSVATPPDHDFGKRRPEPLPAVAARKRSSHVGLLLMGTMAVGVSAYALMPSENCDTDRPAIAGQANDCQSRHSSSGHSYYGGSSSRTSLYSGDTSSSSAGGASSDAGGASHVTRGGFGSFVHAMSSHFSHGG